jgi:predicted RNase H-like HicB family nuclease
MADGTPEIELVFEPQDEGGYHVYAPDFPGLHTQGDDMDDAMANANEAVALYVEGHAKTANRSTAA